MDAGGGAASRAVAEQPQTQIGSRPAEQVWCYAGEAQTLLFSRLLFALCLAGGGGVLGDAGRACGRCCWGLSREGGPAFIACLLIRLRLFLCLSGWTRLPSTIGAGGEYSPESGGPAGGGGGLGVVCVSRSLHWRHSRPALRDALALEPDLMGCVSLCLFPPPS